MPLLYLITAFAQSPGTNPSFDAPEPVGDEAPADVEAGATTGIVEFDARLPAEIQVDGQVLAQLYTASTLTLSLPVGPREVVVRTNGRPRALTVDVSRTATGVVFIGRNGLTATSRVEDVAAATGTTPVELRVVGREGVTIDLGDDRFRVQPGGYRSLTLPLGRHALTVRSASGTVLWARGHLELTRNDPVIIQVTEGRMPEVTGPGSAFTAGS